MTSAKFIPRFHNCQVCVFDFWKLGETGTDKPGLPSETFPDKPCIMEIEVQCRNEQSH